jgi:hypothetical protein
MSGAPGGDHDVVVDQSGPRVDDSVVITSPSARYSGNVGRSDEAGVADSA